MKIQLGERIQTNELLGESIKVFLKEGGSFYFKVTGCNQEYLDGFDDEGMNIRIVVEDIDFVCVGGDA